MQKAVVLTAVLLSASMAMADGTTPPPPNAAAMKLLQTAPPRTVNISGNVAPQTFVQVFGKIVATIIVGGDGASTNVLNPGSTTP